MARHGFATPVIVNQAMTGNITSTPSNIANLDNVSVQLDFTSGATGTFSLQVSNNYSASPQTVSAGTWITLPVVDQNDNSPVAAGSAATLFLNAQGIAATWCRVVYTFTSGSGTLNAVMTAKGAG